MKRTDTLLLFLFLLLTGYAQNPFATYGYKPKMATLSNGRFDEFHDKNRIVEIGAVRFDTKTNKIVGTVSPDTLNSTMDVQTVNRFISIDPEAERYYSISPYAYCMNNPVRFIDPDGKKVLASTKEVQTMILNTLPKEIRSSVTFDKSGYANIDRNITTTSGNYNAFKNIVLANQTMEVVLDNQFNFVDENGQAGTRNMPYLGVDTEFVGNNNGKGVGTSTGETGFLGKTLLPDLNGLENSPTDNVTVVVNSGLSEEGRAQTYSHEANGHAYIYITTGDRKAASHQYGSGGIDENRKLFNLINKSINETINNMK